MARLVHWRVFHTSQRKEFVRFQNHIPNDSVSKSCFQTHQSWQHKKTHPNESAYLNIST